MLLWLPDTETSRSLPEPLRRLQRRGLEVHYVPDLGPHTKYFPYVIGAEEHRDALVTADDDLIYPRNWLAALVAAHRLEPHSIHCHCARRMRFDEGHFAPYGSWPSATEAGPHPLNFLIGSAGVIYPPEFLQMLKEYGTGFAQVCPSADDIWLNYVAYRGGYEVSQMSGSWPGLAFNIPGSQAVSLYRTNVGQGGNQLQLEQTYCSDERETLLRLASE